MTDISASEARQKFGEILRRASTGEQFIIVREGYPVASLGPPGMVKMIQPSAKPAPVPDYLRPATEKPPFVEAEWAALVKAHGKNSPEVMDYQLTHRG